MTRTPLSLSPLALAAMSLALGMPTGAQADAGFKFSGFGTFGAVKTNEAEADFVSSLSQPNGAGATRSWATSPDSKLGLQANANLNAQWSGVAQVLSRHQSDNTYRPKLSMGFVKYASGSGVDVRVGRIPYAAFVTSDFREVGYSQTLVRPPLEVYSLSLDSVDGGDVTWRTTAGDVGIKLQAMAGVSTKSLSLGQVKIKRLVGANATMDLGNLSARFSHVRVTSELNAPAVQGVLNLVRFGVPANALGPGSPALPGQPGLADSYSIDGAKGSYTSLGLSYDPGQWFVSSELAYLPRSGLALPTTEAYITAGVRLGAFTPYVNWAKIQHKKTTVAQPLLQNVLDGFNGNDRSSISTGLRWDFAKNMDAKLQFDRVSNATGSSGYLINPTAAFMPGRKFSVITLAVDVVF